MYVYPDVESLEAVEADDSKCQTFFYWWGHDQKTSEILRCKRW